MGATDDQTDAIRRSELLLALTTEHSTLQSARATTVSESASRSSLYLTTVSSAVVALALVAQVSKLGQAFFIFSLAILPVLFALGLITYGRLLQSGSEDVIYARSISRIRTYYAGIDPSHAGFSTSPQWTWSVFGLSVSSRAAGSNFWRPRRRF